MTKPRIGITPSPSRDELPHGAFLRFATAAAYVDAVLAAGGVPMILPPQDGHAAELLDAVDALLLSGGADIEPARYGATEVHPTTYGVSPERDQFELELVEAALARDLPLLGICRGIQVLNVALGGTLIQDVASQRHARVHLAHRQHEVGLAAHEIGHVVTLVPDTALPRLFASGEVGVNSFHHQAIDRLASPLVAAAHAPDGLIEAAALPERSFVVGVQWHPELMFARHPEHLRPFQGLVEAAVVHRLVRATV